MFEGDDLNILSLKAAGILKMTSPLEMHACLAPAKFRQLLCMRAALQWTVKAWEFSQTLCSFYQRSHVD